MLQSAVVLNPLAIERNLLRFHQDGNGSAFHLTRPVMVGTVALGRVLMTTTTGIAARQIPGLYAPHADEAHILQLLLEFVVALFADGQRRGAIFSCSHEGRAMVARRRCHTGRMRWMAKVPFTDRGRLFHCKLLTPFLLTIYCRHEKEQPPTAAFCPE